MKNKVEIVAPIVTDEEKYREIAAVLSIPSENKRQADLQYFTAVFVTSGGNLNYAYFLPSELFKARNTIDQKAIDLEHMDRDVVGHIYDKAFVTADDKMEVIDPTKALKDPDVDGMSMHTLIAGVVYSNRFPEVSQDVKMGHWKVSMECYYDDYELKIGDIIIPKRDAESIGYAEYIGKPVIVKSKGKEVCSDMVYRVLRGILFTGCGFVKHPANPPSVILEYAALRKQAEEENLIIELENIESYMKDKQRKEYLSINSIDDEDEVKKYQCISCENVIEVKNTPSSCSKCGSDSPKWELIEKSNTTKDYDDVDGPGICVNYKKAVYDVEGEGGVPLPESKVIRQEWCNRYDQGCTTNPGGKATDPDCLRFKFKELFILEGRKVLEKEKAEKIDALMNKLDDTIRNFWDNISIEEAQKWTREFINDLPDSAFAVIEPGYPSDTENKNARHLPHHDGPGDLGKSKSNANLDLSHYRNALARANQIKPITDSISQSTLRERASNHLERHRDALETED